MGNAGLEVALVSLLVPANGLFAIAELAVVCSRRGPLTSKGNAMELPASGSDKPGRDWQQFYSAPDWIRIDPLRLVTSSLAPPPAKVPTSRRFETTPVACRPSTATDPDPVLASTVTGVPASMFSSTPPDPVDTLQESTGAPLMRARPLPVNTSSCPFTLCSETALD